jgi:hypothetical protein
MDGNEKTVGELREFLAQFDDNAPIGVIMMPYGGMVKDWYQMIDFEDEGIENPSPYPYPTLKVC